MPGACREWALVSQAALRRYSKEMRNSLCIALLALAASWAADSDVVQPAELAAQMARHRDATVVLYVGPNVLYRSKHIPGAIYAGPANRPEGLDLLQAAAAKVPRDAQIVLYCGCCPWDHCPNIRPALQLMRQLGFAHVRALYVPDNFKADWIDPGYPVETGADAGR
jgi:3-mercaptopyruvate sulfurtransferase SseA